jgi:ABC-2 type transport system ATP-binding protein
MNADLPALSCQGLTKRFGSLVAVDGLDLRMDRGECFGLLGPNGAGKTSTIEMLEGITSPDRGEIQVLGRSWREHKHEIRQLLGIQLQETHFQNKLRVQEVLALFRSFYLNGPSVSTLLQEISLTEKASAFVEQLSGGQKQRLALGCALAGSPEILFLDEPTTGLDPQARRQIWELIARHKAAGGTAILTTHYMDEAQQLCDRIAIMDHGRLIALGTPRELIRSLGGAHVVEWQTVAQTHPSQEEILKIPSAVAFRELADHRYCLTVQHLHLALPELIQLLERGGSQLLALSTHQATLEDVFLNLTGRSLRES